MANKSHEKYLQNIFTHDFLFYPTWDEWKREAYCSTKFLCGNYMVTGDFHAQNYLFAFIAIMQESI